MTSPLGTPPADGRQEGIAGFVASKFRDMPLGSSHEGCNRQATHPFCDLPLLRLRKCRIQYVPLKCDPAFEAMLLTISTTHEPATDLGFLLHKNPARSQSLDLAFGQAHMLYPEAGETCCTFALLLDLDPVALVRGGEKGGGGPESRGQIVTFA
ncbi:MAG TPA: hypothetical protein VNO69_06825 [Methyloceanibacter sp.]|nr:hypothetical protein [Methyloceanibacter sp.]